MVLCCKGREGEGEGGDLCCIIKLLNIYCTLKFYKRQRIRINYFCNFHTYQIHNKTYLAKVVYTTLKQ